MKKIYFLFLIFVLISPWFLLLLKNYKLLSSPYEKLICRDDLIFIDQINRLRGESIQAGLGIGGRFLINKLTFCLKSGIDRYLESFDPHFLFFTGDLDVRKSTQNTGPLYLSFLPMIIAGLYYLFSSSVTKRQRRWMILLLFLAPFPTFIVLPHYETLTKIILFLVLTFLASLGFGRIFNKKRILAMFLLFLLVFEVLRFVHDLYFHYPERQEIQIEANKRK